MRCKITIRKISRRVPLPDSPSCSISLEMQQSWQFLGEKRISACSEAEASLRTEITIRIYAAKIQGPSALTLVPAAHRQCARDEDTLASDEGTWRSLCQGTSIYPTETYADTPQMQHNGDANIASTMDWLPTPNMHQRVQLEHAGPALWHRNASPRTFCHSIEVASNRTRIRSSTR